MYTNKTRALCDDKLFLLCSFISCMKYKQKKSRVCFKQRNSFVFNKFIMRKHIYNVF